MNRRDFLKTAAIASTFPLWGGLSHLAFGAESESGSVPTLVVVFLRGGADGLNFVAPSDDPDYEGARSAEVRVMAGGVNPGHLLKNTDGFRMHPAANELFSLYDAGQLGLIHAVGLENATRSHFVAQELIERGLANETQNEHSGWIARALDEKDLLVPIYSATDKPVLSSSGSPNLLSSLDLNGFSNIPYGAGTLDFLSKVSDSNDSEVSRATKRTIASIQAINKKASIATSTLKRGGTLRQPLESILRLMQMDVGLKVACVDHYGWDTHENQAPRYGNLMKELSQGIGDFYENATLINKPILILVMTEFGRRLRINKSGGTDHGHGACWMLLGQDVNGGKLHGHWPGLGSGKLDQGVDLAVTTDYRKILVSTTEYLGMKTDYLSRKLDKKNIDQYFRVKLE